MDIQGLFFATLFLTSGFADLSKYFEDKKMRFFNFCGKIVLVLNSVDSFAGIKNRYFVKYGSKRLESVTKVITSSSLVKCAASCLATDGCYAVNFKNENKSNCELTSGLSDVNETVDDVTADLFIMGEYILVKTKGCLPIAREGNVFTSVCHSVWERGVGQTLPL